MSVAPVAVTVPFDTETKGREGLQIKEHKLSNSVATTTANDSGAGAGAGAGAS